eukprot:6193053-Pleurochrysis_carterae.AAC.4
MPPDGVSAVLRATATPGTRLSHNTRNALPLTLPHRARLAENFAYIRPDIIARLRQPCMHEGR